jgi:hypothetical protein
MLLEVSDGRQSNLKTNVPGLEKIYNHNLEVSVKVQSMIVIPIADTRTLHPTSYRHPTVMFLLIAVHVIAALITVLIAVHRAASLFRQAIRGCLMLVTIDKVPEQ